jgi:hypothetical protein
MPVDPPGRPSRDKPAGAAAEGSPAKQTTKPPRRTSGRGRRGTGRGRNRAANERVDFIGQIEELASDRRRVWQQGGSASRSSDIAVKLNGSDPLYQPTAGISGPSGIYGAKRAAEPPVGESSPLGRPGGNG